MINSHTFYHQTNHVSKDVLPQPVLASDFYHCCQHQLGTARTDEWGSICVLLWSNFEVFLPLLCLVCMKEHERDQD